MKNIELEDKKLSFEPCVVEVIHFGEDIIMMTSETDDPDMSQLPGIHSILGSDS